MFGILRSTSVLVIALGVAVTGCDSRLDPGEEGCEFDREADLMVDDAFAWYLLSGGYFGDHDEHLLFDDGTIHMLTWEGEVLCESQVPGGEERAAGLARDIADTGVFDAREGCYEPSNDVMDGFSRSLILSQGDRLHRLSSYSGAGPEEISEVAGLIEDYVAEAEPPCE